MTITHDYVAYATGNDYKGSTFTDGSFANATLTLTKAGAFAATKVNHWLYLDDNGSGEVTTGYYRVTSIAGAPNAVVLHADIRSGANDPTDVKCTQHDGTTSLPWRSLQGACDLCTRNTSDGNQINLKAGTAQVNAAALDLTTFIAGGALSGAAPLIIRGYTSAANDGGMGEIDCNGATMFAASTYGYIVLGDLEIHNGGNNTLIALDDYCTVYHCEIHRGASTPSSKYLISFDQWGTIIDCYLHDPGTVGTGIFVKNDGALISGNYIALGAADSAIGISTGNAEGSKIYNNIISCADADDTGISMGGSGPQHAAGNIIYNSTAGVGRGIHAGNYSGRYAGVVMNNIICGWSGAGGAGIETEDNIYICGYNAFYNNTANYDLADQTFIDLTANDVALAADPFTDAANGDFSLTAAGKTALRSLGWPASYLGAHANTDPHITIGPMQYGPTPAAAGGGFPILGGSVVR